MKNINELNSNTYLNAGLKLLKIKPKDPALPKLEYKFLEEKTKELLDAGYFCIVDSSYLYYYYINPNDIKTIKNFTSVSSIVVKGFSWDYSETSLVQLMMDNDCFLYDDDKNIDNFKKFEDDIKERNVLEEDTQFVIDEIKGRSFKLNTNVYDINDFYLINTGTRKPTLIKKDMDVDDINFRYSPNLINMIKFFLPKYKFNMIGNIILDMQDELDIRFDLEGSGSVKIDSMWLVDRKGANIVRNLLNNLFIENIIISDKLPTSEKKKLIDTLINIHIRNYYQ